MRGENFMNEENIYNCWLRKGDYTKVSTLSEYLVFCNIIIVEEGKGIIKTAINELKSGIKKITGIEAVVSSEVVDEAQPLAFILFSSSCISAINSLLSQPSKTISVVLRKLSHTL